MRSMSPSFCCWSQELRLIYMNDVILKFCTLCISELVCGERPGVPIPDL